MVSKIRKVEVVGYVFLGLCHLPCLTELKFYEDENRINGSKNPTLFNNCPSFLFLLRSNCCYESFEILFLIKKKIINWKTCCLVSLSE